MIFLANLQQWQASESNATMSENLLKKDLEIQLVESSNQVPRQNLLYVLTAVIYLAGIIIAEIATSVVTFEIGLIYYGSLLILLVIHAANESGNRLYGFLQGLIIVCVIRLLSLLMPLTGLPLGVWLLMMLLCLYTIIVFLTDRLQLTLADIGLNMREPIVQVVVAFTGIAIGLAQYQLLLSGQLFQMLTTHEVSLAGMLVMNSAAVADELIFRGLLLQTTIPILGPWAGVFISIVYATMHWGHSSLLNVGFIFVVSLFYTWIARKTGSILGITVSHLLASSILFLSFATALG